MHKRIVRLVKSKVENGTVLSEELQTVIAQVLSEKTGRLVVGIRLSDCLCGCQAKVFVIDTLPHYQRYALKLYSMQAPHNPRTSAENEFRALQTFYGACRGRPDIAVPEPLALLERDPGYLMRHLEGRCLVPYLRHARLDSLSTSLLAKRIVDGLAIFYGSVGGVYGDFQPRNLLVGSDLRVGFLDPTIPDPGHLAIVANRRFAPWSADMGYWLFSVLVKSISRPLPQLNGGRPLWHLTQHLFIRECNLVGGTRAEAFALEVTRIADRFFRCLDRNPRERLLRVLGRTVLKVAARSIFQYRSPYPS